MEQLFNCNTCGETFKGECDLGEHLKLHEAVVNCHSYPDGTLEIILPSNTCTVECAELVCSEVKEEVDIDGKLTEVVERIDNYEKANSELDIEAIKGKFCKYTCCFCGKKCMTKYELGNHERTHTKERPFHCNLCDKTYCASAALYKHKRKKHHLSMKSKSYGEFWERENDNVGSGKYVCSFCGKRLGSLGSLKLHETIHTGDKPFHCSECMMTFRSRSAVLMHTRRIHKKEPILKKKQLLLPPDMLLANNTNVGNIGNRLSVPTGLTSYRNMVDKSRVETLESTLPVFSSKFSQGTDKLYRCPYCPKTWKKRCELVMHVRYHTGERPHICPVCPRDFILATQLYRHIKEKHDWESLKHKYIPSREPLKCPYCPKTWKRRCDLIVHVRYHTGERPYICPGCPRSFTTSRLLNLHVKSSHDWEALKDQFYKALEQVRNGFVTFNEKESSGVMDDRESIKCVEIPTKRMARSSKNIHMYKYKCSFCGKGWKKTDELKQHERIHTGEKPHKCSECGQAFRTLGTVYNHIRRVHKVEPKLRKAPLVKVGNTGDAKDSNECRQEVKSVDRNGTSGENDDSEAVHKYRCSFCSIAPFLSFQERDKHERSHDAQNRLEYNKIRKSKTSGIGSTYKGKSQFSFNFKCSFCDKKWRSRLDRRLHETIHTGEKPFQCSGCDLSFRTRDAVMKHTKRFHENDLVKKKKTRLLNPKGENGYRTNCDIERNNCLGNVLEIDKRRNESVEGGNGCECLSSDDLENEAVEKMCQRNGFDVVLNPAANVTTLNSGEVESQVSSTSTKSERVEYGGAASIPKQFTVTNQCRKDNDEGMREPHVSVINCTHSHADVRTHSTTVRKESRSVFPMSQKVIKINYNGQMRLFTLQPFECSECVGEFCKGSNSVLPDIHHHGSSERVESVLPTCSNNKNKKCRERHSNETIHNHSHSYGLRSSNNHSKSVDKDKEPSSCGMDLDMAVDIITHSQSFQSDLHSFIRIEDESMQVVSMEDNKV